ncbi:MAG: cbb3-type cytochrome c oxidase subunit II [Verrucomicrobiota bacterium]|nr:cbb3-type cytochrome c oxidase subunit II [Verrucomicrobiota bacterium]
MKHGPLIFLGLLITMGWSWFGLIFTPYRHTVAMTPDTNQITQAVYPFQRNGLARKGAEVYRANGCYACHTQQVRSEGQGNDQQRGWGTRHTVAKDFLYEDVAMTGSQRLGPDLANVGARIPDANWHLLHLYNPKIKVPKSNMAPYPYLFEKRKAGTEASNALQIPPAFAPKDGSVIVPTPEAVALVAYLLSLNASTPVFEAPPKTNAAPSINTNAPTATLTNAPAGASNAVPQ